MSTLLFMKLFMLVISIGVILLNYWRHYGKDREKIIVGIEYQ